MKNWIIEGYAGNLDYNGPEDYNFHYLWALPATITKSEIEALLLFRFKQYKYLVVSIIEN